MDFIIIQNYKRVDKIILNKSYNCQLLFNNNKLKYSTLNYIFLFKFIKLSKYILKLTIFYNDHNLQYKTFKTISI
jgi:hypothetical protein